MWNKSQKKGHKWMENEPEIDDLIIVRKTM